MIPGEIIQNIVFSHSLYVSRISLLASLDIVKYVSNTNGFHVMIYLLGNAEGKAYPTSPCSVIPPSAN
jgi:hypothetical protein